MNEVDPHSQIRTTSQPCQIHTTRHIPEPHVNHRHHVYPLGDGGPDIEDNIIVICPTGHFNTHDLLAHYRMLQGKVPYAILKRYSVGERKYAELGYNRIIRGSM